MKLSVVATLFKSAPCVQEFCRRAAATAQAVAGDDYELILVNDGSPDDSLALAVEECATNPRLRIIDLSRNFGHHRAIMTGLAHAASERIFLLDSDLEEEPEWLVRFHEEMNRSGADVVFGVQAQRKGDAFERWTGSLFYRLLRLLTGLDLPENPVTARLMTRRYVDALLLHKEREIFIVGLWVVTGFAQLPLIVTKHSRSATTYTFRHKMALLVNSVTSFSNTPLIAIFYTGIIIFLLAGAYAGYIVMHRLLGNLLPGWASVMASIWLLGGLIISFLGIIGIYLSKIFSETKHRPYTIVRHIYGK
jgi:putative glycosyltransferase